MIKSKIVDGHPKDACISCGDFNMPWVPDVYFKEPYFDEHLGDQSHPNGRWVVSARQKADLLKALGAHEAGDRVHGARNFTTYRGLT